MSAKAALLGFALTNAILIASSAAPCSTDGGEDESCVVAEPRGVSGSAMLQTHHEGSSKATMGPLKLRLTSMEKEVASLKGRMSVLETEITGGAEAAQSGGQAAVAEVQAPAPAPVGSEAAMYSADEANDGNVAYADGDDAGDAYDDESYQALVSTDEAVAQTKRKAKKAHKHNSAALLAEASTHAQPSTVKERTSALESDVAGLKSRLSTLENQVSGNSFVSRSSLLQMQDPGAASLKARITSIEESVDSCRTRISTLEHLVVG